MTGLSKMLLASCIGLSVAVVHLSREQVTPAGPRNLMTMVRNPWTGTVLLCAPYGGECQQTYPAIQPAVVTPPAVAEAPAKLLDPPQIEAQPFHFRDLIAAARRAGYSDEEIADYLGLDVPAVEPPLESSEPEAQNY